MQDYPKSSADFSKVEMAGKHLCQEAAKSFATTVDHCLQRARSLRQAGEEPDKGPKINFSQELLQYAMRLDCLHQDSINKTAVNLANLIISDIRRSRKDPSKLTSILAPEERYSLWRKLHITPGGANAEKDYTLKICSRDMDITESLFSGIRMGILNHYNGHFCLDIIREILADPSLDSSKIAEPLIPVTRLVKGDVRGIIVNIDSTEFQDNTESEIHHLGTELAKDNIVIKSYSPLNIGKLIESAVKTANELNIDTQQLPIIIRILDYPKEKSTADYFSFLAFGWLIHISANPEIFRSIAVLKTINDTMADLSLGKIMLEKDFYKTIRYYREQIEKKRASLGLS